jgi:hypothetical protein
MSNRLIAVVFSALLASYLTGCFGGDEDSSTSPIKKTPRDTSTTRFIVPGQYVGDYNWIDSNRFSLESEFKLDSSGVFRHLFVFDNEATYDHSGNWVQKAGAFYFSNIHFSAVDGGLFDGSSPMEDDTNAVRDITDSTFTRLEWTPLRQKPYWITYKKKTYPQIKEGTYRLSKTHGEDSNAVKYTYRIELAKNVYLYSITEDTLESFQVDAKYKQVGSFLLMEEHRIRELDSTNTRLQDEWFPVSGTIYLRLQALTDTAFSMWTPPYSPESLGFDPYSKNVK